MSGDVTVGKLPTTSPSGAYAYATIEVGNLRLLVRNFNGDVDETNRTVDSIAAHLQRVSGDFAGWSGKGQRVGDGDPDRPVLAHAGEG